MPLLNLGNRRSQQAGNAQEIGKLDYRIGNPNVGQGVFLTGAERVIPVEDSRELWESDWILVPYGATSGALDAGDAFGNTITFERSELGVDLPRLGRIVSIKMVDRDDDTLAASIHIFRDTFTAAASDAAFTISVADAAKWVASEAFDAGTDIGSAKVFTIKNVNVDYYAPTRKLYAQLSTSGTPNIASAAVMPLVKIYILPLGA